MRIIISLIFVATLASAQFAVKQPDGKVMVTVPLIFLDAKNLQNGALQDSQFQVKEDGQEVQGLSASVAPDEGIALAILFDASNSQKQQFDDARRLAIDAIQYAMRVGKDRVAVGAFDTELQATKFTDNKNAAMNWLETVSPKGGTALYDAIYKFCEGLTQPPRTQNVNVVMFVLSDGGDNQSRHTLEEAAAEAQRTNVTIIAVSTEFAPTPGRGERGLKRLAEQTGGVLISERSRKSFDRALEELVPKLINRIYLTYTGPPSHARNTRSRSNRLRR